ncbi:sensor domain-containing protein [Massilia yuzhufengensis]|uniref:PAS domain S-box-containing protein/diguanylate cyclase (GGDEF) domain-containing protein n=1 Tax=Massilia yuzhufengensis TaxID=1164594 RepID=A0A1I1WHZ7_9BURK|nr:bifunctional diguanylate cyclase/phosphodiesterase [Massilia yuzhufengensis]SFD92720.1 PAS domain S-box-containing protein/diguanylate cyclase (GGDEF) domain-containing protein [Massilia yuzhufengensis]
MNLSPLPLAVFVVDAAGAVTSWNKACEKLAGYPAADIDGMTLERIIEFDDPPGPTPRIAARADAENDGVLKCADGRRLGVRIMVAPQSFDVEQAGTFSVIVIPRAGQLPPRYALIQDLPVADIIESLPCVFYVIDQSGHLLLWNKPLEEALEMEAKELPTSNVKFFFDEKDRPLIVEKILSAFEYGCSTHEAELIGKHGKRTAFLFQCARTSLGNVPCVFGTGLDISARKQAELGLRVRERAIYSSLNAIVITYCEEGEHRIEYVNPAFERITGYTLAEIRGRDPRFMGIPGCDEDERRRIRDALKRKESVRAVLRNSRKNGDIFWNDLRIDPVSNIDGDITHFVGVINDITEARHYERRLHHLAHHDPLTGLANRTLLQERLRFAIDHAQHAGSMVALAFLDLDNFKHINDNFGHAAGDHVLRETAQRLRENMREDDVIARVGGDEFVLLMCNPASHESIADLVERIRRGVMAPVLMNGQEIFPGTSIGVSLFPEDGDTPEKIMRAADAAMYHAKTLGKNNFQFYSAELNQIVHEHLMLEASLSRAIREHEMVLDYQPKVDLRTGKVVGAEALVRWRHPVEGMIPPDRFIPVAEETGLIVPLGEWVIDEACGALKAMRALGMDDFVIAVNLSARQLRQRQFAERLGETLRRHGVDPRNLELEVTESQLMEQPEDALGVLGQLKALGVRLSIDDFGTGYSSLSHLQKFPVDYIKIDRSFLGNVGHDGHLVITRAIIALGHNLKLKVVAEGVETREQIAFLRKHNCDQMQGYYFSPALPQDVLQEMVARDQRLPD